MVMGHLWLPWQEAGAEPHLGLVLGTEPLHPHSLLHWLLWQGGLPLLLGVPGPCGWS